MTYSFQHNILIIKLFSRHELQDAVWDEVDFLPMCGRGSARFRLTDIWNPANNSAKSSFRSDATNR